MRHLHLPRQGGGAAQQERVTLTNARESYDELASGYDRLTSKNNYDMWLGDVLLPVLGKHGLLTGRALDVGCGTGRAFEPLLTRGWEIVGCDLSPAMIEQAKRKFGDDIPLSVLDARELPVLGTFDLVLALNDTMNYMTEDGDLDRALTGMRANLGAGGLLLFDTNSLAWFRSASTDPAAQPGGTYETMLATEGIDPHPHRQRHFTDQQLREAMAAADLQILAMLGQREESGRIILSESPDHERDAKTVCIGSAGA